LLQIQLIQQRQLPPIAAIPPKNFNHQEPPPPYQRRVPGAAKKFVPPPQKFHPQIQQQQFRVIPQHRSQARSRVEEYRNRQLSDSELDDSERNQQRVRSRSTQDRHLRGAALNLPRQRSNEILLG
jgi:hypothetical protein